MPGRKELLQDFYAKYAPDQQLTEERLSAIDKKYGDNDEQLLKDFYAKYAPDQEVTTERIDAIYNKYGLKKKEPTTQGLSFGYKTASEAVASTQPKPKVPLKSPSGNALGGIKGAKGDTPKPISKPKSIVPIPDQAELPSENYAPREELQKKIDVLNQKFGTNYDVDSALEEMDAPDIGTAEAAGRSFLSGVNSLASAALYVPEYLRRVVTNPIMDLAGMSEEEKRVFYNLQESNPQDPLYYQNKIAEYYRKDAENLIKPLEGKFDKDFMQQYEEGDYIGAAKQFGVDLARSIPATIGIAMATASGVPQAALMPAGSLVFASQEYQGIDPNTPMTETQKQTNSFLKGFSEQLFEGLGTGSITKQAAKLIEKEGVDNAKVILAKQYATAAKEALKPYFPLTAPLQEFVTEGATALSQNVVDKFTDPSKKDISIMQGVPKAAIMGLGMGTAFGGAPTIINSALSAKAKVAAKEAQDKLAQIEQDLDNPNLADNAKKLLNEERSKVLIEINNVLEEQNDVLTSLPQAEKEAVLTAQNEIADIDKALTDENITDASKTAFEGKKTELETQIDEIINKQTNDTENIAGLPSEIGGGQELVETQPIQEGSGEPIEANRILQAPQEEVNNGSDIWKLTQSEVFSKYEDKDTGEGLRTHEEMVNDFLSGFKKGKEGISIEGNNVVYRNENGLPIGFAHFDENGIREIGVKSGSRGKSISTKLVDYLKSKKGIDKILPPFSKDGSIISHRNEVKKALAEGKYDEAIKNGELTRQQVDKILKSAKVVSETVSENLPPVVEQTTTDVGGVTTPNVSEALKDVESTAKALELVKDKKVLPSIKTFSINGLKDFYHASQNKRQGRLRKSNAPQFGTGIYFSSNKDLVENEFGENVTNAALNLSNPVFTNTRQWDKVSRKAIELADAEYGKNKNLKLSEDESYFRYDPENLSEIDEIPSNFISDAAQELGYDAIIDEGSSTYENEIIVLDDSKIIYDEDVPDFISEAYHKAKADGSNPELVKAVEELLGQETKPIESARKSENLEVSEREKEIQLLDTQKKITQLEKELRKAPLRPSKGKPSQKQIRTQIKNYRDQLRELEGKAPKIKPVGSVISRAISRFQSEVEVGNLSNEERLVLDLIGRVSESDKDVQGIDRKQVANQKKKGVIVKNGETLDQIVTDFISENNLDPNTAQELRDYAIDFLSRKDVYEFFKDVKERESTLDAEAIREDEYYNYGYELAEEMDMSVEEMEQLESEISEIILSEKQLTDKEYAELQNQFREEIEAIRSGEETASKGDDKTQSERDNFKEEEVDLFEKVLEINDTTKLKSAKKAKISEVISEQADNEIISYIAENIDDIKEQLRNKVGLTTECKW